MTPIQTTTKNADIQRVLLANLNKSVIVITSILALVSPLINVSFTLLTTVINTYLDNILAVGSYSPNNVKAEVLNTNRNVWSVIQDYPYVSG